MNSRIARLFFFRSVSMVAGLTVVNGFLTYSFEPDVHMLCVCPTTPTQKLFCLYVFRQGGPPQRIDCLTRFSTANWLSLWWPPVDSYEHDDGLHSLNMIKSFDSCFCFVQMSCTWSLVNKSFLCWVSSSNFLAEFKQRWCLLLRRIKHILCQNIKTVFI